MHIHAKDFPSMSVAKIIEQSDAGRNSNIQGTSTCTDDQWHVRRFDGPPHRSFGSPHLWIAHLLEGDAQVWSMLETMMHVLVKGWNMFNKQHVFLFLLNCVMS